MKLVTIQEFQALVGLPDSAMLWMLNNPEAVHSIDPKRGILLDLEGSAIGDVVRSLLVVQDTIIKQNRSLIVERISSIISDNLESIFADAMQSCQREDELTK